MFLVDLVDSKTITKLGTFVEFDDSLYIPQCRISPTYHNKNYCNKKHACLNSVCILQHIDLFIKKKSGGKSISSKWNYLFPRALIKMNTT